MQDDECRVMDVNLKYGMNGSQEAFTLYPLTFRYPHLFSLFRIRLI